MITHARVVRAGEPVIQVSILSAAAQEAAWSARLEALFYFKVMGNK